MALSYNTYTGDGSNTLFAVTFPYISKADVSVLVNAVPVTFTWVTASLIQTDAVPALATTVVVKRTTPRTPLVTYVDDTPILATDLNEANDQAIYIGQEALDAAMAVGDVAAALASAQAAASTATAAAAIAQAASLIDLANPISVTADTVVGANVNKFYNCTPPVGTIKNLQLPGASVTPGAKIFVRVTDAAQGMIALTATGGVGDSIIAGWPNGSVLLIAGESLLLEAFSGIGWVIMTDGRKCMTGQFTRSSALGDIALTNDNGWKEVTFDTPMFGALGTQWGPGNLFLVSGKITFPRRMRARLLAHFFCVNVDTCDAFQATFDQGSAKQTQVPPIGGNTTLSCQKESVFNAGDIAHVYVRSTLSKAGTLKATTAGFEPTITVTEVHT